MCSCTSFLSPASTIILPRITIIEAQSCIIIIYDLIVNSLSKICYVDLAYKRCAIASLRGYFCRLSTRKVPKSKSASSILELLAIIMVASIPKTMKAAQLAKVLPSYLYTNNKQANITLVLHKIRNQRNSRPKYQAK